MAITNFFSQVAALDFKGCLNLTLHSKGESLTVSVLLQNDACGAPDCSILHATLNRLSSGVVMYLQHTPTYQNLKCQKIPINRYFFLHIYSLILCLEECFLHKCIFKNHCNPIFNCGIIETLVF